MQLDLFGYKPPMPVARHLKPPVEWKVVPLRECPAPEQMMECDTPQKAVDYWRLHIPFHPAYTPDCECFVVLHLNTRRRVRGHHFVSVGTMDSLLVHPREVYRVAIATASSAIICMHNHPSGDPSPSDADVRVTRDLARAGQLLKIELLDHVVVGKPRFCSLREMGLFAN